MLKWIVSSFALTAKKLKTAAYTSAAAVLIAAVVVGCTFTEADNNGIVYTDEWFCDEAWPPAQQHAEVNGLNISKDDYIVFRYTDDVSADVFFPESDGARSVQVTFVRDEYEVWLVMPVNTVNATDRDRWGAAVGISDKLANSVPAAVSEYACDFAAQRISFYHQAWDKIEDLRDTCRITDAKVIGITQINTGSASLDYSINMYLLEYRLLVEGNTDSILASGMSIEDGCLTEQCSAGQPYLILLCDVNGKWTRICVTYTDTIEAVYGTSEMLERYGDAYTAAAMELYHEYFQTSVENERTEQTRLATIDGFEHMPFDELPKALSDSLTLAEERGFDGFYPDEFGIRRTYRGYGIEIVTTAPSAAYLDRLEESDKDNRDLYPSEEDFWAYIEGEEGREWIVEVTITDSKYATLNNLRVGATIAEADALGYTLNEGENTFGCAGVISLSVFVENGAVVRMKTWWRMGRYIGKFFEL